MLSFWGFCQQLLLLLLFCNKGCFLLKLLPFMPFYLGKGLVKLTIVYLKSFINRFWAKVWWFLIFWGLFMLFIEPHFFVYLIFCTEYNTIQYITVQNTIQCSTLLYSVQYNRVHHYTEYNTMQYITIQSTLQYSTLLYRVQYNTVHYCTECNTMQYITVQSTIQ